MAVLKQKTISVGSQRQRIGLKRKKNKMHRGGKYQYEIVDLDSGSLIEDPYTNKSRAESEFEASVRQIRRGMESAENGSIGGDFADDIDVPSLEGEEIITDPFEDDLL